MLVEHENAVVTKLVEWLQHSDFAGVIFAREKFEGTFPLESVHANTADAPDFLVALRWNNKTNRFGTTGEITTDSGRSAGDGSHGTLSEFDVHNTLIAGGPDFRHGFADDLPSANVDIAPTVLRLLGVNAPGKFDGRVLSEALKAESVLPSTKTETVEATRKFPTGEWRQHLRVSHVGDYTYIDEGNGSFDSK